MRLAHNDVSLKSSITAAQSEAKNAFNDGTVFIEKYHEEPRHVEVQILGDKFGHVVHLWERDCSLQRRHQKLVEESPCPIIDAKTRQELCDSAVRLAKEAGYYSACTVEFIMDKSRKFYFLEVNTRIQVEHPVTELVTGVDLVKWQLRIAAGEKLTLQQKDIPQNGCAMECRINAEDPAKNFMPCPGTLEEFVVPGGPGVRMETHAYQGYRVPPNYDSMIAKLLVHRGTRAETIKTMSRALEEFRIAPIKTTIPLHQQIMRSQAFRESNVDTGWIERTFKSTS
jgi:acetyl-CoA carboxylase biotin carboxylase subunit